MIHLISRLAATAVFSSLRSAHSRRPVDVFRPQGEARVQGVALGAREKSGRQGEGWGLKEKPKL